MRKLILDRIEEITEKERGYPRSLMRWQNYHINGVHISEVGFNNLTDEQLLIEFERLIRQINKQM